MSNTMNELNIVIMGSGGVGKSALANRYTNDVFVHSYDSTIEDTYRKETMIDDKSVTLEILDTAGQEDFRSMHDSWIENGDGFLLVYDITNKNTFDELQSFYLKIRRRKSDVPILLTGNKCDMADEYRKIAKTEGEKLAKDWGVPCVPFLETSAKESSNVHAAFEDLARLMIAKQLVPPKKKTFCILL